MAKAVLEETENAEIHPFLDLLLDHASQRAIDRRARGRRRLEQEGQIDEAKLRHAVGEIARRLVAEREQAVLDQPEDVLGAVAELHDVPDVVNAHAVAEFGREAVTDEFERTA